MIFYPGAQSREERVENGLKWQVDNNQKSTINIRMEEPVLWAKSGGKSKYADN